MEAAQAAFNQLRDGSTRSIADSRLGLRGTEERTDDDRAGLQRGPGVHCCSGTNHRRAGPGPRHRTAHQSLGDDMARLRAELEARARACPDGSSRSGPRPPRDSPRSRDLRPHPTGAREHPDDSRRSASARLSSSMTPRRACAPRSSSRRQLDQELAPSRARARDSGAPRRARKDHLRDLRAD